MGVHTYTHTLTHTTPEMHFPLLLQAKKTSWSKGNSLLHPPRKGMTVCVVKMEEQGHQKGGCRTSVRAQGPGRDPRTSTMAAAEEKFKTTDHWASRNPRWPLAWKSTQTVESWNLHVIRMSSWFSSLGGSNQHRKTTHVQKKARLFSVAMMRREREGEGN